MSKLAHRCLLYSEYDEMIFLLRCVESGVFVTYPPFGKVT